MVSIQSLENISSYGSAVPFDEHLEGVCYTFHELDDFWVGEVRTRVAIDRNHLIPFTQPGPGGFALASNLRGTGGENEVELAHTAWKKPCNRQL